MLLDTVLLRTTLVCCKIKWVYHKLFTTGKHCGKWADGWEIKEGLLNEMALAFKGLTEYEVNNLLALAYADDGELTRADLHLIFEQKQQIIKKAGILEMIPLKEKFEDIGGLENLKEWFVRKAGVYKDLERAKRYGVDMPKDRFRRENDSDDAGGL